VFNGSYKDLKLNFVLFVLCSYSTNFTVLRQFKLLSYLFFVSSCDSSSWFAFWAR